MTTARNPQDPPVSRYAIVAAGLLVSFSAVVVSALAAHASQPHKGAVRQEEFDRTYRQLADDIREIRNDLREMKGK